MQPDLRWPSASGGRSRVVARGGQVFTVANATDGAAPFGVQLRQTLAMLDEHLAFAGSSRAQLLSVHVYLTDFGNKAAFDAAWSEWIGPDSAAWPQRAVTGAPLAGGLLLEIVATAFR